MRTHTDNLRLKLAASIRKKMTTEEAIAARVGASRSTIWRFVNGGSKPSYNLGKKIEAVLSDIELKRVNPEEGA